MATLWLFISVESAYANEKYEYAIVVLALEYDPFHTYRALCSGKNTIKTHILSTAVYGWGKKIRQIVIIICRAQLKHQNVYLFFSKL